ncbi:hypothetical protein [Streptomyces sp. NBC_01373]|uniref:hypothetical protein n=1 Tax=Streptomyces sp. NBC_01373 TaxID=2903843 RepID=UPI002258D68C|nr:hypothetical protein [Streptomyces sp. NBC_01373]MCX4703919.1 hypothetical protein [Streptomyces sp. NBC_01373]
MNTAPAAVVTLLIILGIGVPALWWQIRQAARHESQRDRIIREAHERATEAARRDGHTLAAAASAERLPADIEDHLTWFLIDHPDVAEGFARLRQAVRDEQQKGD